MTDLIAEIGWNHMGDMDLAEEMVSAAADSGASYAKFQTWSVSRLKHGEWDNDGRRQIYEKAELTEEKHKFLISVCHKFDIKFMSSCFSLEDAKLLLNLGVREVKIPSFEVRNHLLIDFCLANFEKVIISTGTANTSDIHALAKCLKLSNSNVVVMHCVSAYPCDASVINLPRIAMLRDYFESVGFSDHTQGVCISILSLSFSPVLIEKHFTVSHDLPGRDNKFGILPSEMLYLKNAINDHSKAIVSCGLDYQLCEQSSRDFYSGRFSNV